MLKTPNNFTSLLSPVHDPAQLEAALNFVFQGDALLLSDETLELPSTAALAGAGLLGSTWLGSTLLGSGANAALGEVTHEEESSSPRAFQPVGLLAGRYCQTLGLDLWPNSQPNPPTLALPVGYSFRKLRSLFGVWDDTKVSMAARACQIAEWARSHKFCGACGARTIPVAGERCMRCTHCNVTAYPRISPAMMVLIKRGDEILLARHRHSAAPMYTALAGFLEAGESVEEAVHREVLEEVGLRVHQLSYFGSQPWPFPHSLMIAFTAEYLSGEIQIDERELSEARWFGPKDALPLLPYPLSIARHLIDAQFDAQIGDS